MRPPYLLISDTHYHNWTAFLNEGGLVNSRLQIQLNKTENAVEALVNAGGKRIFHAGDMFHVRGKIHPSVMNPVSSLYKKFAEAGHGITVLSGNHDLESDDAMELTSSVSAIAKSGAIQAVNEIYHDHLHQVVMIPWYSKQSELVDCIEQVVEETEGADKYDLIIHAAVNNVLINIPNTGLEADYLSKVGFKRVFVGHYHNHKQLADNVWSIGALTHQTWGDVGSKAGFMLVWPDRVEHVETSAPKFVRLGVDVTPEEEELVEGNYIKADLEDPTPSRMNKLRNLLKDRGAAGVIIRPLVATKSVRSGTVVSSMDSLTDSISKFAKEKFDDETAAACLEIYNKVVGDV